MKVNYVTRDAIRAIRPMDMEVFDLPSASACDNARVQVAHVKNRNGGHYKVHVDYKALRVAIKRLS